MPFLAIQTSTGKYIDLGKQQLQDKFYNPRVFKDVFGEDFVCPCADCESKVYVRKTTGRRMHFAHVANSRCKTVMQGGFTSRNHEEAAFTLATRLYSEYSTSPSLKDEYGECEILLEFPFPEINRRADIAVVSKEGTPLKVHECQLSKISNAELEKRTEDYEGLGIECIWHFGASAAEDKSLTEWFIRNYGYLSTFKIYNTETNEFAA